MAGRPGPSRSEPAAAADQAGKAEGGAGSGAVGGGGRGTGLRWGRAGAQVDSPPDQAGLRGLAPAGRGHHLRGAHRGWLRAEKGFGF